MDAAAVRDQTGSLGSNIDISLGALERVAGLAREEKEGSISMSVLTPEAIASLAARIGEIDLGAGAVCHVEMGELADGSMRPFALITTIEGGDEETYRISGPAAAGAPHWAASYWSLEARIADRWRIVPFAEQEEPVSAPGLLDRVGAYLAAA